MPRLHLHLAEDVLTELDHARGLASRSAYVSALIGRGPGTHVVITDATRSGPETTQVRSVGIEPAAEPGHRHRRHEVIGKSALHGKMVDQWACSCGKVLT